MFIWGWWFCFKIFHFFSFHNLFKDIISSCTHGSSPGTQTKDMKVMLSGNSKSSLVLSKNGCLSHSSLRVSVVNWRPVQCVPVTRLQLETDTSSQQPCMERRVKRHTMLRPNVLLADRWVQENSHCLKKTEQRPKNCWSKPLQKITRKSEALGKYEKQNSSVKEKDVTGGFCCYQMLAQCPT